ncbi:MAG TPA: hypothetical protein VGI68_14675 [Mycobacterium sp.]
MVAEAAQLRHAETLGVEGAARRGQQSRDVRESVLALVHITGFRLSLIELRGDRLRRMRFRVLDSEVRIQLGAAVEQRQQRGQLIGLRTVDAVAGGSGEIRCGAVNFPRDRCVPGVAPRVPASAPGSGRKVLGQR